VLNSLRDLTADYTHPIITKPECVLTEPQRLAIERRVEELSTAELAGDIDVTMAAVVELLEGFGGPRPSDDQARLRAKAYITALEGVPTWCVIEAGRRWLRAEAGPQKYDYPPSPPRLAEIAKSVRGHLTAQRCDLQRLLRAKPDRFTHERSDAIKKGYAELLANLTASMAPPRIEPEAVKARYGLSDAQWNEIPDMPAPDVPAAE
jgi:hypothetical protein